MFRIRLDVHLWEVWEVQLQLVRTGEPKVSSYGLWPRLEDEGDNVRWPLGQYLPSARLLEDLRATWWRKDRQQMGRRPDTGPRPLGLHDKRLVHG